MFLIRFFNDRVKRLTIFDVKLVQGAAMFLVLAIAKLFPEIMEVSIWWFIVLTILCALRPMYVFFLRE